MNADQQQGLGLVFVGLLAAALFWAAARRTALREVAVISGCYLMFAAIVVGLSLTGELTVLQSRVLNLMVAGAFGMADVIVIVTELYRRRRSKEITARAMREMAEQQPRFAFEGGPGAEGGAGPVESVLSR